MIAKGFMAGLVVGFLLLTAGAVREAHAESRGAVGPITPGERGGG